MFAPALVTFLYPFKPTTSGNALVVSSTSCDVYITPAGQNVYNITLSTGGASIDEISRNVTGVQQTIAALQGLFGFLGI